MTQPMVPQEGDMLFCRRPGAVSVMIAAAQRLRGHTGAQWTHVAYLDSPTTIIEALTHGVVRNPLSKYFDSAIALAGINLCVEEYSAIYALRDNPVL